MLRQIAGMFMLGKFLRDKKFPWKRRRQLGMAVAGNTPTANFLIKIGKMQSAGCRVFTVPPKNGVIGFFGSRYLTKSAAASGRTGSISSIADGQVYYYKV